MFFARRNPDRIAGADFPDRAAFGLHPSYSGNDKQRLSQRMRVPCRARAGLEADACGVDPRRRRRRIDWILPDRTGEPVARRAPGGPRTCGKNIHGVTSLVSDAYFLLAA